MVGSSLKVMRVDHWVVFIIDFLGCVVYYHVHLMPVVGVLAGI
jgi:hypothetical protein